VYLVMQRCWGPSVGELLLRSGQLSEALATHIVRLTCEALEALHAIGILHRWAER